MRKSIFDKTMDESYFSNTKEILEFSDEELAQFLDISIDEYNQVKNESSHFLFNTDLPPEIKTKISKLSHMLSPISGFKFHKMKKDDILGAYKRVHKKSGKSLKQLLNNDDVFSEDGKLASQIIEKECLKYFTHYEIGEGASDLQKLNVKVSTLFLKAPVAIKEKWIYEEFGGDCTVPQAQHKIKGDWTELPKYSTEMGEAWKLVEILATQGVQIRLSNKAMGDSYWWCYLSASDENKPDVVSQGLSGPEAICLAIVDYCTKKNPSK
jgi:hypothetical protein